MSKGVIAQVIANPKRRGTIKSPGKAVRRRYASQAPAAAPLRLVAPLDSQDSNAKRMVSGAMTTLLAPFRVAIH